MPNFGLTNILLKVGREVKVIRPAAEKPPIPAVPSQPAGGPALVQAGPPATQVASPAPAAVPNPPAAAPAAIQGAPLPETPAGAIVQPAPTGAAMGAPAPAPRRFVETAGIPEAEVAPRARAISSANLGEFDLEAVHQTNFDTISTTDDIKAVIAEAADRNAAAIDVARRGTITNDQLKGLAADLNVQEDIVRAVMERESGGVLRPEVILGARQVLNSSADRLLGLAKKIQSGQATDIERLQFRRQVQFHDEYQQQFMGARAETGRALNAFGIPVGIENEPMRLQALKQAVDTMHGADTDALAAMISNVDNIQGINRLTREYSRSRVAGTLQELFINSILSGPKTHIINFQGNALFSLMNVFETAVAARLGRMLPGADHIEVGEATALIYGQITGFQDAMRVAAKAFREGRALDDAMRFEGHTPRAISSANYFREGRPHPALGAAVDLIGTAIRVPTERVMAPMDEFAKMMAYRAELHRRAYLHAMDQTMGKTLGEDEIAQMIRDFLENPPQRVITQAEEAAQNLTFQQPLGPIASRFQAALSKTPGAFFIAPFIKTPVNLFKAGLMERSPLALFSEKVRRDIAGGGRERDMALAKLSMGTLTVGTVATLTASGFITGGGPQNPDARRVLEADGWQPYSVAVPNDDGTISYQSYARLEPLAYVIGATADAVEVGAYLDYDDEMQTDAEAANNVLAAVTAGVANNTMSKTFLQGVADFSEALSDPKRYMANFLQSAGSALVPYSSFRRQVSQMEDPIIREAWTLNEKLTTSSGIPGWSAEAPPRRDIFGEPMYRKGGSLLGVMSPFPDTRSKNDPVMNEVISVMEQTRTVPLGMPGRRVEGMKLTVEEYDELVRYSRQEPLPDGKTFRDHLADLVDSSAYQLATPDFKVILIKQIQNMADQTGRAMLEQNNESFADRLADHRLLKQGRLFGAEAVIGTP